MGFWDTVGKIAVALRDQAATAQVEAQRRAGNQLREYERKIGQAEKSDKMNNPEYVRRVQEAKEKLETAKRKVPTSNSKRGNFEQVKDQAPNQVGVYIMEYNGRVMYVGRAIEDRPNQSPKGLRKRLQEHWRGAANCKQELFLHRDYIWVTLKLCHSVEEARQLEARFIRQYDTVNNGWNLRYED
ncbi:MAG TPA: hypothetical protein VEV44_13975 [Pseudoneobacillus sp.]|nr:hypothetical protein [Pseudoneobacillus sp.]